MIHDSGCSLHPSAQGPLAATTIDPGDKPVRLIEAEGLLQTEKTAHRSLSARLSVPRMGRALPQSFFDEGERLCRLKSGFLGSWPPIRRNDGPLCAKRWTR